MLGRLASTIFTFGLGYYIAKNHDEKIMFIYNSIKKSDQPPLSITKKGVKVFGTTVIKYE